MNVFIYALTKAVCSVLRDNEIEVYKLNSDIDIVIPWVDGSDPEWQIEFKKYSPDPLLCDVRFERYRDLGLLKYWFRGIEEFQIILM